MEHTHASIAPLPCWFGFMHTPSTSSSNLAVRASFLIKITSTGKRSNKLAFLSRRVGPTVNLFYSPEFPVMKEIETNLEAQWRVY